MNNEQFNAVSSCCGAEMDRLDIIMRNCPECDYDCSVIYIPIKQSILSEQDGWLNPNPNDQRQLKLF